MRSRGPTSLQPGKERREGAAGVLLCHQAVLSEEPAFRTADPKMQDRDLGANEIQKSLSWHRLQAGREQKQ